MQPTLTLRLAQPATFHVICRAKKAKFRALFNVMKQTISFLIIVLAGSAIAGWKVAQVRMDARLREAVEKERAVALVEAKKPAKDYADLVRHADVAVLSFNDAKGRREVRVDDPAWLARLAAVIEEPFYIPTPIALWVSTPEIIVYQKQREILRLMVAENCLRAYHDKQLRDFVVGRVTVDAFFALAKEKEPNQPPEPTR